MTINSKPEKIVICGIEYLLIDVLENITVSDSFVLRNKIGIGHGEAKLYVGQKDKEEFRRFFNNFNDIKCFFVQKDLEIYLSDASFEYEHQEQGYKKDISNFYNENQTIVADLNPVEYFGITETDVQGPRFYINSSDDIYKKVFRTIALPIITYLSILRLINTNDNKVYFYFRPFLDYFYDKRSSVERIKAAEITANEEMSNEKKEINSARLGQGKYRQSILEEFPAGCVITKITDERLLIASHIKPWIDSDDNERVSRYNGLLLSPTFDKLFDQGFITFQNDGTVNTSPYISPLNWRKIGLQNNKTFDLKRNKHREQFLEYHRTNIFKGVPE